VAKIQFVIPLDVSVAQRKKHHQMMSRVAASKRFDMATEMAVTAREIVVAGIRERNPLASEELLRWMVVDFVYGEASAHRLYGEKPKG
jgi:hypothetical protein